MLKDAEIVVLRDNAEYKLQTKTGLKNLVVDLINSHKADFKPDISFLVKVTYNLAKARVIRKELVISSRDFLERILNYELRWPRTPESVRSVCEAQKESFIWMRFDAVRVEALFSHSRSLLTDAKFRNLIKSHSTIEKDKNVRLTEILDEMKTLLRVTLRSINTRGIFDNLVGLRAKEYYEDNETEIQQRFLDSSRSGALGLLPEAPHPDDE